MVLFTIIHDFAPASSKWCRSIAGKSLDDEGDAFYLSGQREQRKSLLCYLYLYHVFRLCLCRLEIKHLENVDESLSE